MGHYQLQTTISLRIAPIYTNNGLLWQNIWDFLFRFLMKQIMNALDCKYLFISIICVVKIRESKSNELILIFFWRGGVNEFPYDICFKSYKTSIIHKMVCLCLQTAHKYKLSDVNLKKKKKNPVRLKEEGYFVYFLINDNRHKK